MKCTRSYSLKNIRDIVEMEKMLERLKNMYECVRLVSNGKIAKIEYCD